jgi:toxin-antitoxin system PIN domain toxin
MLIPDVNVLIYAFNASAPLHAQSRDWWQHEVSSGTALGIPLTVFQGFLRLLTNRKIVPQPYTVEQIFNLADDWWLQPNVSLLHPTRETYKHFRHLVERYQLAGSASTDGLIAAFALEHRSQLVTNDTDFLRFEELRVYNPFSGRGAKARAAREPSE